jgi:hypothetical protein
LLLFLPWLKSFCCTTANQDELSELKPLCINMKKSTTVKILPDVQQQPPDDIAGPQQNEQPLLTINRRSKWTQEEDRWFFFGLILANP